MADQEKPKDVQLLKSTRISVFVDEALQDMLVVTYEFGVKIYKGILLDYTKRNLPHGVTNLNPAFNTTNTKTNPDDDVLYSVNQRFAYMDPNLSKPKNVRIPSKYKNNKMTVRLRPRQVLCSKCKGICNENSENVSKKRKSQESVQAPPSKRSANAPITRSVYSEQLSKKKISEQKVQPILIPKLSRLLPQEISNALNGNLENLSQSSDKSKKETVKMSSTTITPTITTTTTTTTDAAITTTTITTTASAAAAAPTAPTTTTTTTTVITTATTAIESKLENDEDNKNNVVDESDKVDHSTQHSNSSNLPQVDSTVPVVSPVVAQDPEVSLKSVKRTLRKKRSIGSMEDLWDESVFEEAVNLRNNEGAVNNNGSTVTDHAQNNSNTCVSTRTIKISYGPQGEGTVLKIPAPIEKFNTSDDSEENINITNHNITKGIDNKAARKALKRARKKARQKRLLSGNSPSHINALSPRYTIGGGSPRYTIVGTSPRHCIGNNSPRYVTSSTELHVPKRHKHKLKRKKKHRDDKDRKHKEEDVNPAQENGGKEQAVTQKLSINLKRLHSATYTSCQNTSDKGEENTSSSDEHSEQAPDFPPPNPPLILRVNAQTVSSALGADGGRLLVGDVVWGKIHGFPWWPGKVLTITSSGNQGPQAHVAWYGSSTSSLIQCDQLSPYLDNFKIRYNKKKRGAYKEAIRQATTEARENAEARLRKEAALVSSPSQSIMTVPPPALASPREIDVMS